MPIYVSTFWIRVLWTKKRGGCYRRNEKATDESTTREMMRMISQERVVRTGSPTRNTYVRWLGHHSPHCLIGVGWI
jgi:hypothetical protein